MYLYIYLYWRFYLCKYKHYCWNILDILNVYDILRYWYSFMWYLWMIWILPSIDADFNRSAVKISNKDQVNTRSKYNEEKYNDYKENESFKENKIEKILSKSSYHRNITSENNMKKRLSTSSSVYEDDFEEYEGMLDMFRIDECLCLFLYVSKCINNCCIYTYIYACMYVRIFYLYEYIYIYHIICNYWYHSVISTIINYHEDKCSDDGRRYSGRSDDSRRLSGARSKK